MLSRYTVPVFRPTLPPLSVYTRRLKGVWRTKMVSNFAKNCTELEGIAKNYIGCRYTVATASADLGLIIAIKALDIPENSEVIVPSFSFNSTANCILWNGLVPVFVDVDKKTLCLDPESVKKKISPKTKLIIATHVFGNPAAIDDLQNIANTYKISLLFDAAHAYGSEYRGRKIGNFGDAEVMSFSGTKLVTCAEGGMVCTNNEQLFNKIEAIRDYGFVDDYNSKYLGINGKISELNAALGCLSLPRIDCEITKRYKIANTYKTRLGGVGDIVFQETDPLNKTTYKDFCILTAKREELYKYLLNRKIQTKKYFLPIHMMDFFKAFRSSLPITEMAGARSLCLPIFGGLTTREQNIVINSITSFFKA